MYRYFAPLLLAFALSGCDVLDSLEPSDTVAVPVSTIRLESVPQGPSAIMMWDEDDQTGPDLFVEIQNSAGLGLARSSVISDADVSQEIVFQMPADIGEVTPNARLFVTVFDDDGGPLNATRISTSASFSVEELEDSEGSIMLQNNRTNRTTVYEVIR